MSIVPKIERASSKQPTLATQNCTYEWTTNKVWRKEGSVGKREKWREARMRSMVDVPVA